MKDKHIIEVIDSASFLNLSQVEIDMVNAHANECDSCRTAVDAARVSALAMKARAQEEFKVQPSPFFQTRVMAAWREQQAADNVPAFLRLWKSASALVSSMALATIILGAMTFVLPDPATALNEQTASLDAAESVILDQADEPLTYEQVLSTIYQEEEEAK